MYDDYNDYSGYNDLKKEMDEAAKVNQAPSYSTGAYTNPTFKDKKTKNGGFGRLIAASLIGAIIGSTITGTGFMLMRSSDVGNDNTNSQKIELVNKTDNIISVVAEKAGPSTVGIEVVAKVTDFFFGQQSQTGTGSGVIIKEDGYIMTNYHVIQDALDMKGAQSTDAEVNVYLSEEKVVEAKIVGYDERTDLAVLKVEENKLPAIEFADSSELKVGDQVVAIGNPGGLELAGSITAGVISGLNRTVGEENNEIKLIQTDASINPGNSGGALVNLEGKLVGVNSSKIASVEFEGIGFAIPSNDAKRICESLIENKYVKGRPWIGVEINGQYNEEYAERLGYPVGLYVSGVSPFSAAEEAGIKQGDIITKFNGKRTKEFEDLEEEKNELKPGDSVKVEVYRDEQYLTLDMVLAEDKNIN